MSSSNCCFLICMQISQETGKVVWYSHLFQKFPQFNVIHTVKGFGIVNKAEIDVFLELSCFFHDPADVGNLISGSSAFPKSSFNIWKFTVHVLLKPGLENFEHYWHVRWVQLCGSLSLLWLCLSLGLEWKLTFSSPVATDEFSKFAGILSAILSQPHLLGFEIAQPERRFISFIRVLISFMKALPSWPNHFPDVLPTNIISFGIIYQNMNWSNIFNLLQHLFLS